MTELEKAALGEALRLLNEFKTEDIVGLIQNSCPDINMRTAILLDVAPEIDAHANRIRRAKNWIKEVMDNKSCNCED